MCVDGADQNQELALALPIPMLPERSAPKMVRSDVVVYLCTMRLSEFAPSLLKAL
jgi:hypothetical protein